MKNKKISIIIPVYNAEKYINRCLDSILTSTYKNLEILIMNDGSTDKSLEIIKKYEKNYKFIHVYDHKNQGVAKTRNDGIKYATGDFIMFIDNDDYISSDYIENYYKVISSKSLDVVIGGYERIDSTGKILSRTVLNNKYEWSKYMIVAPWAKIYRTKFIRENNILFLDSNIGEDIFFNIQVINLTKKIGIIDDICYKWFFNEISISNTVHKKANSNLQFDYLLDTTFSKMEKLNFTSDEYVKYFFIKTICWFLMYIKDNTTYNELVLIYEKYFKWYENNFSIEEIKKIKLFFPKGEKLKSRLVVKLLAHFYINGKYKRFFKIFYINKKIGDDIN